MIKTKVTLFVILLLSPLILLAQGGEVIGVSQYNSQGYMRVLSGATITICTYTGSVSCISPLTIYSDEALTQPLGTSTVSDGNGNYNFFISPGSYVVSVAAVGYTAFLQKVTVGITESSFGAVTPVFSLTATGGTRINTNGQLYTSVTDLTPATTTYGWFQNTYGLGASGSNVAKGVGGFDINMFDAPGVTGSSKGILYGGVITINPSIDRNNIPYDDATGLIIQNNGSGIATDGIFFGNGTNISGTNPQWQTMLSMFSNTNSGIVMGGTHANYGIDLQQGTYTLGAMRLPFNSAILARNSINSADLPVISLGTGNSIFLGSASATSVITNGTGLVPGNTSAPSCDATHRGNIWYVPGASSVLDLYEICTKNASDVYAWQPLYGGDVALTSALSVTNLTTATGGIKIGASGSTISDSRNLIQAAYNISGTNQLSTHIVYGHCTLGTSCSITLSGSAVFTSSTSYECSSVDETSASAVKFAPSSGSAFSLTGTGTDVLSFTCIGN